MTREEAINDLKDFIDTYLTCHGEEDTIAVSLDNVDVEALDMAIKALEQEPCDDAISREYLFKVLDDFCGHDRTATITLDTLADLVYDMPPVNPQEPCSNCCNGNQIEKAKLCQKSYLAGMEHKQEPKTGHWIKSNIPNEKYVCSECGGGCWYYDYQADVAKSRYCPNCGAKMVDPQESEDKE